MIMFLNALITKETTHVVTCSTVYVKMVSSHKRKIQSNTSEWMVSVLISKDLGVNILIFRTRKNAEETENQHLFIYP